MEGQMSLFATASGDELQEKIENSNQHVQKNRPEGLSNWYFLYTAGRSGHNSGIRFMMTREDAQAWCESDLSRGVLHGNPWAYFFTSVGNFCFCHWGQLKGATLDLRKLKDNGQWDEKIEGLGLTKYGKQDIKKILSGYGIEVLV